MRTRTSALFALALLAVAPAADAKKSAKPKQAYVQTGAPLPEKPIVDAACDDDGARFLGSDPIVPFAVVKKNAIASAGQHCCAPWARKGAAWNAIDAYGQVVGDAVIDGGEGYDATQCYELSMSVKKGNGGVGLWVDAKSKWSVASAEWKPSAKDRAAVAKLVGALEAAMVPAKSWNCQGIDAPVPIADRSIYFVARAATLDQPEIDEVAVGGPIQVIARREASGKWVAEHVDSDFANVCGKRTYKPLAVFDMNNDGAPEVLFHFDFGDGFGDVVLGRDGASWDAIAESVGGSTA